MWKGEVREDKWRKEIFKKPKINNAPLRFILDVNWFLFFFYTMHFIFEVNHKKPGEQILQISNFTKIYSGKASSKYTKKYLASEILTHNSVLWSPRSTSDKSISSITGISPSLPSQGCIFLIFGNSAPLTGAVCPLPYDKSRRNSWIPVFPNEP